MKAPARKIGLGVGIPSFKGPLKPKGAGATPKIEKPETDPFAGVPMARSPGMRRGPLLSRFKGLKTKDITLIAAGFSVLLMAPLAEHLISATEDETGTLQAGFDQKGSVFSGAGSPYEDGIGGAAPGALLGQDSEIITPLNARDPSALIVGGPGGEEPPVVKSPPRSTRPASTSGGWKDAISSAAKRSVASVTRRIPLPRPSKKLSGRLNSLSSSSSGSSGAHGVSLLPPPSAKEFFGNPKARSNLSRVEATPDYRGAARRGTASGGSGFSIPGGRSGMGTGAAAGGGFLDPRPTGGGVSGDAASGASFGGRPNFDGDVKTPGLSAASENKNISISQKEDLAYERRKMEMQKAIDLKWAKKQYDQIERKKMLEQMAAQTASQALLKVLDKVLDMGKGGGEGGGGQSSSGGGGQQSASPEASSTSGPGVPTPVGAPTGTSMVRDANGNWSSTNSDSLGNSWGSIPAGDSSGLSAGNYHSFEGAKPTRIPDGVSPTAVPNGKGWKATAEGDQSEWNASGMQTKNKKGDISTDGEKFYPDDGTGKPDMTKPSTGA